MTRITVFSIVLLIIFSCKSENRSDEADEFIEESKNYILGKEYPAAIEMAQQAVAKYKDNSDASGLEESYFLMARASALSGELESALTYGKKAHQIIESTHNDSLEYKVNNILIYAYSSLGRDLKTNLEFQKRQVSLVELMHDDEEKAMVYNNYSYDGTVSGFLNLDSLITYAQFANGYYAKIEKNNGRWYTLMNLTWQYRLINDLSKSEESGRLAVAQAEMDNDRHAIIEANTNLGQTLLVQQKVMEAGPLYTRGLELSKEKNDRDKYVFDVYYAEYLWLTGNRDEAILLLKKAINFLETNEIFYEMLARAFLADFSFQRKDYLESQKQISIFKKPRADYFSLESKIMANMVEAQLLGRHDVDAALKVLKASYSELEASDARFLKHRISNLMNEIKS